MEPQPGTPESPLFPFRGGETLGVSWSQVVGWTGVLCPGGGVPWAIDVIFSPGAGQSWVPIMSLAAARSPLSLSPLGLPLSFLDMTNRAPSPQPLAVQVPPHPPRLLPLWRPQPASQGMLPRDWVHTLCTPTLSPSLFPTDTQPHASPPPPSLPPAFSKVPTWPLKLQTPPCPGTVPGPTGSNSPPPIPSRVNSLSET